jgi:hypothetical protein
MQCTDIDPTYALNPRAISNKLFGFIAYNWKNCKIEPFLSLGGEVEWGSHNSAANQWGIIFKGGLAF